VGRTGGTPPTFYADPLQAHSRVPGYALLVPRSIVSLLTAALVCVVAACAPATPTPPPSAAAPSGSAAAGNPSVIPVIVSTQQAVGSNRFVFSFLDPKTNLPAASPDRTATVAFIPPGATDPGPAVPGTFVWAIEGSRGDYVAMTDFPTAGDWKAVFVTQAKGGPQEAIGVGFDVLDKASTVGVGQPAPSTTNPVAADVGGDLAKISSDPKPDPTFYQTTVADALAAHKPFVLVFATPAFCTSAQCGPTLDRVKAVAAAAPKDVEFINVEPYQLSYATGKLQPVLDANNQLQTVDATNKWGLVSEPWIFTVGSDGIVKGSFEGVVGDDELKAAVAAIAG
jgi:hypothetical protein